MTRTKLVIQEIAVIAEVKQAPPVGEALKASDPIPAFPMSLIMRQDMLARLESSITELMDNAENTYQENCYISGTSKLDPDYITRLSTNEFFFYTKEPLTLKEFEELQNKLVVKAKTLSPGVQLIFGSFAVATEENKVMNVTPHITCGESPQFQFIVKNHTSSIDVRYKIPDGFGDTNTLAAWDVKTSAPSTHDLRID